MVRRAATDQRNDYLKPGRESGGRMLEGQRVYREWLGVRELTHYANVSERTLRSWIYAPVDPLPAVKVSGKVLIRKSDFDAYLQRYRIKPLENLKLDAIVEDLLKGATNGR